MPYGGMEARRHPRHPYCDMVEYNLLSRPTGETFFGASVDVSESGMCLYTFDRLYEGESLEFRGDIAIPYRKATVKWVKEYSGDFYKVGVMFVT